MNKRNVLRGLMLTAVLGFVGAFMTVDAFAKTRHQVTGTGDTQGDAQFEAYHNANQICSSYSKVSETYSKSGSTWTCTLIIECKDN
jgi:hypothetical protein